MNTLQTPKSVDYIRLTRCIYCQDPHATQTLITTRSIQTVQRFLSEDENTKLNIALERCQRSVANEIHYHKKCHSKRRREHLQGADKDELVLSATSPIKKTRATHQLSFDNNLCVFCQSKSRRKGVLFSFATTTAANKIQSVNNQCRNIVWKERLRDVDLVACEVKYHKACYCSYLNSSRLSLENSTDKPNMPPIDRLYQHIKTDIAVGKSFYMTEICELYSTLSGNHERRKDSIKRALLTAYGNELNICTAGSMEDDIVFGRHLHLHDIINAAFTSQQQTPISLTHLHTDLNKTDEEKLSFVSQKLVDDIKEAWSPLTSFEISPESIKRIIPDSLLSFLNGFCNSDPNKLISIAQDLIALSLRRMPPKHITLASTVKHLTGSKILVDMLNKQGHCCSYSELQRIETGIAEGEIMEAQQNGIVIPGNIREGFGFVQAAADNDDFREDTVDGKRTTHATTMVLYQNQSSSPGCVKLVQRSRKKGLKASSYADFLKLRQIVKSKTRPQPRLLQETDALRQIQSANFQHTTASMAKAYNLDQAWILSRLTPTKLFDLEIEPNEQTTPSWSAFNVRHAPSVPNTITAIGYCPMIDNSSTDPNTVYTVMWQLNKIMQQIGQKYSVITFDYAIYHIAKEIQWERPIEFMDTVIRMGGFHILTNYISALGTMQASSGLRELLVEAGLYSDVTVNHIFSGKHYNRGVRAHKLIHEAFSRLLLQALADWMMNEGMDDPLLDLTMESEQHFIDAAEKLENHLKAFKVAMSEKSEQFKFWFTYIQSVQVMLAFIRSERSGNWRLYIDSMVAMLPLLYAYDRQNYSRWLPIYIADMMALEDKAPDVFVEFVRGGFAVNRTGRRFAGVPTDQALEQTLNKDSKTAGGVVGISNNETARTKWFLISHIRAHLLGVQRQLCDLSDSDPSNKEHHEVARTDTDECAIQSIIALIRRYTANPFTGLTTNLVNISTGVNPGPETAKKIVDALEEGAQKALEFFEKRLVSKEVGFYDTLPKSKVPDFTSTGVQKTVVSKKIPKDNTQQSLAKLLIVAKNRNIDLLAILSHEVGNIPLSLFDENGDMRKTQKSQLLKVLEERYCEDSNIDLSPHGKAIVIDGMSFVQTVKGTGTFLDYSKSLLSILLGEAVGYNRIDIVFDVYDSNSIKSAERNRRSKQKLCAYKITHDEIAIPKNWSAFLSNSDNKNELVKYLIKSWGNNLQLLPDNAEVIVSSCRTVKLSASGCSEYPILNSNHDEADTKLILHANDAFKSRKNPVVIRTVDTDVLVLAVHHLAHIVTEAATQQLLLLMGMSKYKRYVSASSIAANLPSNLTSNLLALHALTGCDSTSSIFRVSKQKAVDVMISERFNLEDLGDPKWQPSTDNVISECERFVCKLYGDFPSLSQARFTLLATKQLAGSQLPPSSNALKYHIKRSAYQISIWKNALSANMSVPSAVDHGWSDDLQPYHCDKSPMHTLLLLACGCKKACDSNSCKCKKNNLHCTDACRCNKSACKNSSDGQDDTDSDDSSDSDADN